MIVLKLLVISYNGFSDTNANGKTIKALLHGFRAEDVMQFFRSSDAPDFEACGCCFRVTDGQLLKSLVGKKAKHFFEKTTGQAVPHPSESKKNAGSGRLQNFLKRNHYNYFFRGFREYLFQTAPWGKKQLLEKTAAFSPDAILYLVGDNFSLDHLVLNLTERYQIPLILYNPEAYRIVDLKTRHGLEKQYCRKIQKTYKQLAKAASLILYNCELLRDSYLEKYGSDGRHVLAYNSAVRDCSPYEAADGRMHIAYFGNLGVGRTQSLLEISDALLGIDPNLRIDVYGKSLPENEKALKNAENIVFHGFVGQDVLHQVRENADILLHAESFDPEIMPKLRYAFSTKIAQCLCSGRCFVSYAPAQTASSVYLLRNNCGVVVTARAQLDQVLRELVQSKEKRMDCAGRALQAGVRNHDLDQTARTIAGMITRLCCGESDGGSGK